MYGIFSWDTSYTFRDSKNQTKKQILLSCETAGFFFVLSKNKMLQLEKKELCLFLKQLNELIEATQKISSSVAKSPRFIWNDWLIY